jgi:hypothetical protein
MSRATRGSARQAARRQAPAAPPPPAAPPRPPVSGGPVTRGIDLTGTWKLDMTRSEPLDPYLRAMGLIDMAIAGNKQKEDTTPTFYVVRQTTATLCQRKINWFGDNLRLLEFGRALIEPGASKLTKVFLATHTFDAVVITTDLGQRRQLVDTRTLERTYVDNDTIRMELVLTTSGGDTVRITRYLVRSALPPPAPPPAIHRADGANQ